MSVKNKNEELVENILNEYPDEAKKKRTPHLKNYEPGCSCVVKSNKKSVPGLMTSRGCTYAGAKGVVWGPIKDMVLISNGPVGCGHYSWATRRNLTNGIPGVDNFVPFHFTTDFQERDIVFGGEKKLAKAIDESMKLFPLAKGVSIMNECPVGLIGDDIITVASKAAKDTGKIIVPVQCEGFRGVSQSLGHHIANDSVKDYILGKKSLSQKTKYDVALLGDYNIGGDAWEAKAALEEIGLRVSSIWTGDADIESLMSTVDVRLNILHCYRSVNYICRHMEETYNIPWVEVNFFGVRNMAQSLQKIAAFFDEKIQENVRRVIEKKEAELYRKIEKYKRRLNGKKVMLFVGGLRPRHVIGAFEELGMEVIGTGYEFAHKEDYEKTFEYLNNEALIYDDVSHHEFFELVTKLKPDLVGAGIKEKYMIEKMGIPFRQMHSWDYSGPYHGWGGVVNFARDMDMAVHTPVRSLITPSWELNIKESAETP